MTDAIAYRGPDGEDQWISDNGNVGLGHRRLSIIDLSHNGDQPMHYLDRYTIVFNGEIYNYIELRHSLNQKGYAFKSQSDTEVLLALYDHKKQDCLSLIDGMFAFVIYDRSTNEIFAARDRFGEKPFYYSYVPGKYFLFGSEMKCLWAAGVPREVNNSMLFGYLNYSAIQNQRDPGETFYNSCRNLPHSHYLTLSVNDCRLAIKPYFSINISQIDFSITESQALEKFRELFYTSVKRRLRSDVTVGSSLSGGLDSSLIVCVIDELKKGTQQKQNTFSAIFPGFEKDESRYMNSVIQNTNVTPHFTIPEYNGITGDMEKLMWHQEEPFSTASIYAQYCVMRLAKQNNVAVLLDGQGADEYLAGYHSYYEPYFYELANRFPKQSRIEYEDYVALHQGNAINGLIKKDIKYLVRTKMPGMLKWGKNLMNYPRHKKTSFFSDDFYREHIKKNPVPYCYFDNLNANLEHSLFHGGLQSLLRYCDRNSMAHSREVRLPYLYHELVQFAFTLPPYFKIHKGWTKWLLRAGFEQILPKEIAWRKDKIGYEPPQNNWLQNPDVKEKIRESKRKLYNHHIISKKEFEKNSSAKTAAVDYKSWEIWTAGEILPG
jgi:asparagine synthase (glutamine-hydrolysing)